MERHSQSTGRWPASWKPAMVHACNEPRPRPAVIVVDGGDEAAARLAAAIERCGGEAIRFKPSQNFEAVVLEHEPALIVVDIDLPHPRFGATLVDVALQLTRASVIVIGGSL